MNDKIKCIIICVFFLIFGIPSVLSADSKNIWYDDSCIKELQGFQGNGMEWKQHVSKVFVGEVVWAQPQEEGGYVDFPMDNRSREVKYRITEVLIGDMKLGNKIKLRQRGSGPGAEVFSPEAKFIIGINTRLYMKFSQQAPNGVVAWVLPRNPKNREKAKTFIQCIQDRGIVKAMEKENEY